MTFLNLEKLVLKFIQKHKSPWIAEVILTYKNKAGGITIPDFRMYCRVAAIKTAWHQYKNRHEYLLERKSQKWMQTSSANQFLTSELTSIQGEKTVSSTSGGWKIWPRTNIKSKWIKNLNLWPNTILLLKENIRDTAQATGVVKDFL